MRAARRPLERLIAISVRALPSDRREWGRAMAAEAARIGSTRALLRWSTGLLLLVVRTRARQLLRARRSWRVRLFGLAVAASLVGLAAIVATDGGRSAGPRAGPLPLAPGQLVIAPATRSSRVLIGTAADGTPYGSTIHRLRDLTATLLRCDYAHGAKRHAIGVRSDSFTVTGITLAARRACAPKAAAAEAIQHTQSYADDAAATAMFVERALECVQAQGISLSGPGVTVAERACRLRLEAQQAISEPAPLP